MPDTIANEEQSALSHDHPWRMAGPRYGVVLLATTVFLFTIAAGINFLIDPWQFYRRADYEPLWNDQSRYQNPGLAKNYPYTAVIAGTSVSLGFDYGHFAQTLGAEPINLAFNDGAAREQRLILEVALRGRPVQRVMCDLHFEYFRGDPARLSDFEGKFPAYLYDKNPWNEIPSYLLSIDALKSSAKVLARRTGLPAYKPVPLESLTRKPVRQGRDRVLKAWQRGQGRAHAFSTHPEIFAADITTRSFIENHLAVAKAHPQTRFDFYFPPFSIAYFARIRALSPCAFEEMFTWKQRVRDLCAATPNITLHDFQHDLATLTDFALYVDTSHYGPELHARLVEAIRDRSSLATPESLQRSAEILRREATPDWMDRYP